MFHFSVEYIHIKRREVEIKILLIKEGFRHKKNKKIKISINKN